jgi:hypothetical protein
MQPTPWKYKTGYALFALCLLVMTWRTATGVGHWAWTTTFGDPAPTVFVDPTPTPTNRDYQGPH